MKRKEGIIDSVTCTNKSEEEEYKRCLDIHSFLQEDNFSFKKNKQRESTFASEIHL